MSSLPSRPLTAPATTPRGFTKRARAAAARSGLARSVFALALALTAVSCGADEAETPATEVAPTTDEAVAAPEEAPLPEGITALQDAIRGDFAGLYERELQTLLPEDPIGQALATEPPFRVRRQAFMRSLYGELPGPHLVDADGLNDVGETIVRVMGEADLHAMDPSVYVTEHLQGLIADRAELNHVRRAIPVMDPSADELEALIALTETPAVHDAEHPTEALFEALFAVDSASPLHRLVEIHEVRSDVARAYAGAGALLEVAAMDAFLAYAFDMRHFNVSMLDEDADEDEQHRVIAERMRGSFEAAAAAEDATSAEALMDALPPQFEQYPLLMAELQRYREIVAAGGWQEIDPRHLERGTHGAVVVQLKERLALEGYYDGPMEGDVVDEAVQQAIRDYQTTHQMDVTGESSRDFWSSINVSAEYRLSQIEVTMQRWRESRIGDDTYYVWVNIPDFHAEVWHEGEMQLRYRIVVGNRTRECNPRTNRWEYVNATPVQTARMTYVVLNPYWNVPPRIVEEELLPSLAEDPLYFEEMGFERITTESGWSTVRQLPGEHNPLGRVKFIFPNPHNTYMHDTNRRNYFRYDIRAFSHGCMRVHEPETLLEVLLRNDGQWDEERIQEIWEEGEETSISFNEGIPVHIEYYVVRVDENGRANFLSDVYRYDRERINPGSVDEECDPDPEPEFEYFLSDEGTLMMRDQAGNVIDPNAPPAGSGQGAGVLDGVPSATPTTPTTPTPAPDGADPAADDLGP